MIIISIKTKQSDRMTGRTDPDAEHGTENLLLPN